MEVEAAKLIQQDVVINKMEALLGVREKPPDSTVACVQSPQCNMQEIYYCMLGGFARDCKLLRIELACDIRQYSCKNKTFQDLSNLACEGDWSNVTLYFLDFR